MTTQKPNIILIVSDQHRGDWMSCAGDKHVSTPYLDSLAARGVRFDDMLCNYPLCGPSRMSFLTGRHPFRNDITINEHSLSSDTPTIAHALGLAGYESVLAGRMHFNGADQRHGFEKRLVGDVCRCYAGGPITPEQGNLDGTMGNLKRATEKAGPGDNFIYDYDMDVTDAAEQYISERDDDRPLFLTVGWYLPHHPYNAPDNYYQSAEERFADLNDKPVGLQEFNHPHMERFREQSGYPYGDERTVMIRKNYAGLIEATDDHIKRVCEAAKQLPGPTVIIYTSDHGEHACDHGRLGKGTFFRPALQVPFIIAPLDEADAETVQITKNAVINPCSSLVDLAPTICALAGADALPTNDGNDLSPLLANPTLQNNANWSERPIYVELAIHLCGDSTSRMVQQGPWKYIWFEGEDPILQNLDNDPDELQNLAGKPEHAEKQAELHELIFSDDYNAEIVNRAAQDKAACLKTMTPWGREVGYGADEVWERNQARYIL